jgi:hypothetical protein
MKSLNLKRVVQILIVLSMIAGGGTIAFAGAGGNQGPGEGGGERELPQQDEDAQLVTYWDLDTEQLEAVFVDQNGNIISQSNQNYVPDDTGDGYSVPMMQQGGLGFVGNLGIGE